MANMSYCRFQNTLKDLRDCYYNIEDTSLSGEEFLAREQLLELCKSITEEFGDMDFEEKDSETWDDESEEEDY